MKTHDLERFISVQKAVYQSALNELKAGRKRSHWMWYIFPQIQGLGYSDMSRRYAIQDFEEASEYQAHRVLGPRLILLCNTLLELESNDPLEIFGSPDHLKLQSSMTLFAAVKNADPAFEQVLKKFFGGKKDQATLRILGLQNPG